MLRKEHVLFVISIILVGMLFSGCAVNGRAYFRLGIGSNPIILDNDPFSLVINNKEEYSTSDVYPLWSNELRFTIQTNPPEGYVPSRAYYRYNGGAWKPLGVHPKKFSTHYRIKHGSVTNCRDNAIHYLYIKVYFAKIIDQIDKHGQLIVREVENTEPYIKKYPFKNYAKSRDFITY